MEDRAGTMAEVRRKLKRALENHAVEGAESKAETIEKYLLMLKEQRDWAGLTSRSLSEGAEEAAIESLSVLAVVDAGPVRVVDIGSGGGLLGVVMAIARPEWGMTLAESSGRKAAFLAEAAGSLELGNVVVAKTRAESLAGSGFDVCVSRASGRLQDMAGVALPLLRSGGRYIALKQAEVSAEVESAVPEIRDRGGRIAAVIGASLQPEAVPESVSLVVVEKL